MAGNEDVIREIKERLDIVEVIGRYTQLKKRGKNWVGLSPFRTEKTPSFNVNQEQGFWKDFGSGEPGGDLFKFFMKKDNLDFKGALEILAELAGVSLQRVATKTNTEAEARREHLLELNDSAALFYQTMLTQNPKGEPGREYMAKRGISAEIAAEFQLGYTPDAYDTLTDYLRGRGYDLEDAREIGLITRHEERGNYYDRFRGRFLFPIRDRAGRVVGFGGRALADERPDHVPKYLNSPQSSLFDKSHILYGIDRASDAIRKAGEAVIVEGYVDALTAHQFGYRNVVATMGTALTEEQIALVKRHAGRLVLALDADAAGQMAMLRAVDTLRGALGDEREIVVDARGLARAERRVKVQIGVLTVPAGKDPDEFIRADPAAWPHLVADALPVLDYVIEAAVAAGDTKTSRGKLAVVKQLAPIIRDIADTVERDIYEELVARKAHVPVDAVREAIRVAAQPKPRPTSIAIAAAAKEAMREATTLTPAPGRADYVLSLLLRFPNLIPEIVEAAPPETAEAFTNPAHAAIWAACVEIAADATAFADLEAIRERVPEAIHDALDALPPLTAAQEHWYAGRVVPDATEAIRMLLADYAKGRIADLGDLVQEARAEGDRDAMTLYLAEYMRFNALLRHYPPPSLVFRDLQTPPR